MFISKTPCHILPTLHVYCPLVREVLIAAGHFTQHHYDNRENNGADNNLAHPLPTNTDITLTLVETCDSFQ